MKVLDKRVKVGSLVKLEGNDYDDLKISYILAGRKFFRLENNDFCYRANTIERFTNSKNAIDTLEIIDMYQVESIYHKNCMELGSIGYWFSESAKSSFKCRLGNDGFLYQGRILFISSEKSYSDKRGYTIRELIGDTIKDISPFNYYNNRSSAKKDLLLELGLN